MSSITPEDQEMFIRYVKKLVPEMIESWNIEKKEAIRLAAERWNDMTHTQKVRYEAEIEKGNTAQNSYTIAIKVQSGFQVQTPDAILKEKHPENKQTDAVVKPKRGKSAYSQFMSKYIKEQTQANKTDDDNYKFSFSELTKSGSQIWNQMDDEAKEPYVALAEEDKRREEQEKEDLAKNGFFTNKDGVSSKSMQPKQSRSKQPILERKEPQVAVAVMKPKRAATAYNLFVKERMADTMKSENTNKIGDAMKVLSSKWQNMSEEDQKPFFDASAKDKERHEAQLAEFQEKGSWTLEDGTSSSSLQPKKKLGKRGSHFQKRVYADQGEPNSQPNMAKRQKI